MEPLIGLAIVVSLALLLYITFVVADYIQDRRRNKPREYGDRGELVVWTPVKKEKTKKEKPYAVQVYDEAFDAWYPSVAGTFRTKFFAVRTAKAMTKANVLKYRAVKVK